jgi:hypothetical protein
VGLLHDRTDPYAVNSSLIGPTPFPAGVLTVSVEGPRGLRLDQPERQPDGSFRLVISSTDTNGIGSERLGRIDLLATTNVDLALTNWLRIASPPVLANALLRWYDHAGTDAWWRFDRAVERP